MKICGFFLFVVRFRVNYKKANYPGVIVYKVSFLANQRQIQIERCWSRQEFSGEQENTSVNNAFCIGDI